MGRTFLSAIDPQDQTVFDWVFDPTADKNVRPTDQEMRLYDGVVKDRAIQPPGSYTEADHPFASRGGLKLDAALAASGIDVSGMTCADLGCSTGGFVSCLLHRGAEKVYAVDTGYGVLDYTLRQYDRGVVMERSNALHTDPPAEVSEAGVDIVTIVAILVYGFMASLLLSTLGLLTGSWFVSRTAETEPRKWSYYAR